MSSISNVFAPQLNQQQSAIEIPSDTAQPIPVTLSSTTSSSSSSSSSSRPLAKRVTSSDSGPDPKKPLTQRKSQRNATLNHPVHFDSMPRRAVFSETIDASNTIFELPSTHRLAFSRIPSSLSFIKPLSNLNLEDESEIPEMQENELPPTYISSIAERGFDESLVSIATISKEVGRGVFAARDINAGEFIGFYAGEYELAIHSQRDDLRGYAFDPIQGIDEEEAPLKDSRIRQQLETATQETFGPHEKPKDGYEVMIDAENIGNFTSLINDGQSNANVTPKMRVFNGQIEIALFANKPIRQGYQLLISYGSSYWPALEASGKSRSLCLYPTRYILDVLPLLGTSSPSSSVDDQDDSLDSIAFPDLSPQETHLLDHFSNLKRLAAEMKNFPEQAAQQCYIQAKRLLRPSAPKGSEEIAFAYLSLAADQLSVLSGFPHIQGQISVISAQRYEMKMELLRAESLGMVAYRQAIRSFQALEKNLSQGSFSKEQIIKAFYAYDSVYHQTKWPLIRSLAAFRSAEMHLHLAEYFSSDRSGYEQCLNNAIGLFTWVLNDFVKNNNVVPLTMTLSQAYLQECTMRLKCEQSHIYGNLDEDPKLLTTSFSTPSSLTEAEQLKEFLELKYDPSPLKDDNLKKITVAKLKLLPSSRQDDATALQILDWASHEARQLRFPRRLPHFRLQRLEIKEYLIQEYTKRPKSRSLSKLCDLEEELQSDCPIEILYNEYKKISDSSKLPSSVISLRLFRMGEICMNLSQIYNKLPTRALYQKTTKRYFAQARLYFLRLKGKLEKQQENPLPYTLELVTFYLNEMKSS